MKLLPFFSASALAATSFDDAVSALQSRYSDMGLKRVDSNKNFLKKSARKLARKMQRKKSSMSRSGCFVESVDYDFSLDITKKCNIAATLQADAEAAKSFFPGGNKKCEKFRNSFQTKFINEYAAFFEDKEVTCEVNLSSTFGRHETAIGRVQGDAIVFDGIKYGEHERFMRSTPAEAPETNDLSQPSFSCPVASNVLTGSVTLPRTTPENEDCLYLKVTAPLAAFEDGAAPRKVLTWIHGGTWNFGGMDVPYEDPTPLVSEQDIIVVKMNYRLGAFGSWYFPFRTDGQPKSNFGLLDQRLAMKWVRDNIGSFNGDNADITLAGASAGGAAVSIHATHQDSWDYFDNTIIMSATQISFWPESDARDGYGYISTEIVQCTNSENFVADLSSGALINCLQSIPTAQFQTIMSQAGNVFSKIALDANRLTQLENTFAPNYDGESLLEDPRKRIQAQQHHDDMGFLVLEVTEDEAITMSNNIFLNDQMRSVIFGEHKDALFQSFNQHITLPQAAWQGFIGGLLPQAVVPSILEAFQCPLNPDFGPAAPLLTECVDTAAEFVNAYLFTCPIELATAQSAYGQSYPGMPDHYHNVVFAAAKPGPSPYNTDNKKFMQPYFPYFDKCFAALDNKACHVEGAAWFFGEYLNQGVEITEAQREFGTYYRSTYAKLMKNGKNNNLANAKTAKWTRLSVENTNETIGRPMEAQCQVLNFMEANGGFYGKF